MFASVIILAAGASRRMGRPKPLLSFDGETCLSLVLSAALGSRSSESILVLGADAAAVREAIPPGDAPKVVVNSHHERGQTSSLKTGLDAVSGRADAFVVLPVDQPLVRSDEIDALLSAFDPRPRGRTIFVAASQGRRGHPVLFASSHRSAVLEMSDGEPLNGYVRIREAEVEIVPVDNPGVALEMNTIEQYEQVLSAYRARAAGGSPARPGEAR